MRLDLPINHPNFGKLFPCPCRAGEIRQQRAETLQEIGNLSELKRYTFDTFQIEGHGLTPERFANLNRVRETALEFSRDPKGWLVFRGSYGCGKTHLAAAIANACLDQGYPVLFITVPDLLDELRAAFAPDSTATYSERFNQVRNAPLLIMDDLGTENGTPWAQEKLFQIINHRYVTRLPTVITTNRTLEEIDPRIRSRLSDFDLVQVLTILAPDYRPGADANTGDLNTLMFYSDMLLSTFDLRQGEVSREESDNLLRALENARSYAESPRGWLVFTGGFSCGKTHLAAAIANERSRNGHPALLIVVPDLLDHLRSAFSPQSPISYDKRFEEVRTTPLLVLDDLGMESATPWAQEKLYQLFNYRYVAKLPTVITTSQPVERLDPKLRARLLDASRCTIFGIIASPFRGNYSRPLPMSPSQPHRTTTTRKKKS